MPGISTFSKEELAERLTKKIMEECHHIRWLRGEIDKAIDFICESDTAASGNAEFNELCAMLVETTLNSLQRSGYELPRLKLHREPSHDKAEIQRLRDSVRHQMK